MTAPVRQSQAQGTTKRGQEHALCEQLPDEPTAPRSHRQANCDLAGAMRRPGQEKAGNVGAANDEQQRHHQQQREQWRSQVIAHRREAAGAGHQRHLRPGSLTLDRRGLTPEGERHGLHAGCGAVRGHSEDDVQPEHLGLRRPRLLEIAARTPVVRLKPQRRLHHGRRPDIGRPRVDARAEEPSCRDANDGHGCPVDGQLGAHDVWRPSEARIPVAIADDGDRVPAKRPIVLRAEQAAGLRLLPQGAEEVAGDQLQPCRLGCLCADSTLTACLRDKRRFDAGLRRHLGPTSKQLASALDDRVREALTNLVQHGQLGDEEIAGSCDRQRAQHDGVDQREDRAAGSDTARQRQHRNGREAGPPQEEAPTEPDVLQEVVYGAHRAHVTARVLHERPAPHLALSHSPCVRSRRTLRDRRVLDLLEVELELLVELVIGGPPPEERAKRHQGAPGEAVEQGAHQTVSSSTVTADERRRHCSDSRSSCSRPARVSE